MLLVLTEIFTCTLFISILFFHSEIFTCTEKEQYHSIVKCGWNNGPFFVKLALCLEVEYGPQRGTCLTRHWVVDTFYYTIPVYYLWSMPTHMDWIFKGNFLWNLVVSKTICCIWCHDMVSDFDLCDVFIFSKRKKHTCIHEIKKLPFHGFRFYFILSLSTIH